MLSNFNKLTKYFCYLCNIFKFLLSGAFLRGCAENPFTSDTDPITAPNRKHKTHVLSRRWPADVSKTCPVRFATASHNNLDRPTKNGRSSKSSSEISSLDFSGFPDQMRAAQEGSASARDWVLMELRPWLLAYFARRLSVEDAEDLAQTSLISVFRFAGNYDPGAPFLPWLKAIITNNLIDHYRRCSRLDAITREYAHLAAVSLFVETPAACPRLDLARMLDGLTSAQSRSILLVKIDGFTAEEAGARLGMSRGAVKQSVHRGMRRLQDLCETRRALEAASAQEPV